MKAQAVLLSLLLAPPALALEYNTPFNVTKVFAEYDANAGFQPPTNSNPYKDCLYNLVFLNLQTPAGRAQYAALLAAKASGWQVILLDYEKRADGTCWANKIYFE